jgi:hypothetical protein
MSKLEQPQPGTIRFYQLSYFESIASPRRIPLSAWLCLSAIAVTALTIMAILRGDSRTVRVFGLYGVLIGLVPLNTKVIYTILLDWVQFLPQFTPLHEVSQPKLEAWVRREFKRLGDSLTPCYFGITFALFAAAIYATTGEFTHLKTFEAVSCAAITMLAAFVCGTGLAALFGLVCSIWRLGRTFPVRVSEHSCGILSTGSALMKCYGIVALVWLFATGSAAWALQDRWIVLLAIDLPALCFLVGSFVVCQYPLHVRMVEYKRSALFRLDNVLERVAPNNADEMSEYRKQQVEFCLSEMKRIEKLPNWPFSLGSVSTVVGAWLVSMSPHLIKMAL